jgi:hypothetical protein
MAAFDAEVEAGFQAHGGHFLSVIPPDLALHFKQTLSAAPPLIKAVVYSTVLFAISYGEHGSDCYRGDCSNQTTH